MSVMLNLPSLISSMRVTFSKQNPTPEIFASDFSIGLEQYIMGSMNIVGGNFMFWVNPISQVISITRAVNPVSEIYAVQLGTIIENAISTMYTRSQISIIVPKGVIVSDLLRIFRVNNFTPDVIAVEVSVAIDKLARMTLVTCSDAVTLGFPVTGNIY